MGSAELSGRFLLAILAEVLLVLAATLVGAHGPGWLLIAAAAALAVALPYLAGRARPPATVRLSAHGPGDAPNEERKPLYDALTGLPNRTLLHERLARVLAIRQDRSPVALLVVELDLAQADDELDEYRVDAVLHAGAHRLLDELRAGDTCARLAGPTFAVMIPGADVAGASAAAERLLAALRSPLHVEGVPVRIGGHLGIAVAPEHGTDPATLVRHAGLALDDARHSHCGHALFATRDGDALRDRARLTGELAEAIRDGGLVLHYQPKLDVPEGRVRSVEALVRWAHPEHGLVPPDRFIPLAEQTGLIADLTRWVLETAVEQCATWRADGLDVAMAVNLSVRCLDDPTLPDEVVAVLERHALPANRLMLEVTESALMAEPEHALAIAATLRDAGVGIAIDDFGTGYSSLAYLTRLPAEQLKIDRSFVRGMADSRGDAAIVRSTISLAHELGLRVVAEGVEDADTLDQLARLGCDEAQGYYLTRPVPAADLVDWLASSIWSGDGGERAAA